MSSEHKKRPSARRRTVPRSSQPPALEPERESERAPRVSARRTPEGGTPRPSARRTPSERAAQPAALIEAAVPDQPSPEDPLVREDTDVLSDLEETVDRLIADTGSIAGDPAARRRAAEALSELAARLGGYENAPPLEDDPGLRGLLSTDYYVRQWGRLAMRNRSEQVDDFGLDPTYEGRITPLLSALYRRWFRAEVDGVENVPEEGRAMIVANHGGALPFDGLMVRTALRLEHPAHREPRWLAEDFVYHMPFVGAFVQRVGAVRACPENAERLLEAEELLTVFPEGIKGVGKLHRHRYQLQRFGRGGYVKLALRTGTPIVPAGIAGPDDTYPVLLRESRLAKLVGLPFLPITPTFPWLGPLGLVPLPSRWVLHFGEPIDLSGYGPEAAHDALLVNRINDEIRGRVHELLASALTARDRTYLS